MKKKICLCIVCLLSIFLCSCGKKEDPSLNFPGLAWGMTPKEAKEALKLQDEDLDVS